MAGIKHKATKASGEKGLASEWNDDHEQTGDHDVDQNQFLNQVIENRVNFPGGPVEGQIIYRTDLNTLYIWDGAAWVIYVDENNINNHIGISKGTHYWSCPGHNFVAQEPDVNQVFHWGSHSYVYPEENGILFLAPVFLPHGAVVTAAVVFGNGAASAEGWILYRGTITSGAGVVMGIDNINTEDNTIANATIDNNNYCYFFGTSTLDINDRITGARITYTL